MQRIISTEQKKQKNTEPIGSREAAQKRCGDEKTGWCYETRRENSLRKRGQLVTALRSLPPPMQVNNTVKVQPRPGISVHLHGDRHAAASARRPSTCATALFPIVLTLATGFVTQVLQIHLHAFVIAPRGWCQRRQGCATLGRNRHIMDAGVGFCFHRK